MSLEGVEKTLYDLNLSRRNREKFANMPHELLERYALSAPERQWLLERDVRALINLGANPMLVWGFWMTCGDPRTNEAYVARLRAEARSEMREVN